MSRMPLISSLSFKIFALLVITGVVPVVASAVMFDKIAEFNQDLQIEAEKSIDDVSDVYKAWSESQHASNMALLNRLVTTASLLVRQNNITTPEAFAADEDLKKLLQAYFEKRIEESDSLFRVEITVNNVSYLLVDGGKDTSQYELAMRGRAIRLDDNDASPRQRMPRTPEESEMLVADEDENMLADAPALPTTRPERTKPKRMFETPIELIITIGYDRAIKVAYDKLDDRRALHGSINAMENDENTQLASLYHMFFIIVCALVSLLCVAFSVVIIYPLSHRISKLVNATAKIADGDLETQVEVKGSDQIAFLTQQFNDMVKELKAAQDNHAYIERMQAWQEVARRLAHEIKNPLTPMLLAMQQLDKKFDDYAEKPQKYRKLLDDVMEIMNEEAATLQKLVKEFSSFARLPQPDRQPMNFYDFVKTTIQQNPQFAEQTKRCEVHEPEAAVSAREANLDKELMRRVLVNIVKNGIEAAQNADIEPEIDISVKEKDDEKSGKKYLWLCVIDNGPGLTPEQKEKLFNPYFTTKSDGTGLGLVIVRKIVQDHDGDISLHDRDDGARGTQVDIVLRT